jgi:hypothetical protein
LKEELNNDGVETICADLLEDDQLQALPDVKNVLYLAGTKFGTAGKESFTWAMNSTCRVVLHRNLKITHRGFFDG